NLYTSKQVANGSGKDLSYKEKDTKLCNGARYEYLSENIYDQYVKINQSTPCSSFLKMPSGFVQMIFCINGTCRYKCIDDHNCEFEIESQHHNMVYFRNQLVEVHITPNEIFEGLAIYIRLSHFTKYTLPLFPKLEEFHHQISL